MQQLRIGQPVEVVATTTLEWEDNRREAVRTTFKPFRAVITGQRRKQIGRGSKSRSYQSFLGEYGDYEQGYVEVTGTLLFWECRIGMRNKPVLVADSDLRAIGRFKLPETSGLPARTWRNS